jgi:hypothetical protein
VVNFQIKWLKSYQLPAVYDWIESLKKIWMTMVKFDLKNSKQINCVDYLCF